MIDEKKLIADIEARRDEYVDEAAFEGQCGRGLEESNLWRKIDELDDVLQLIKDQPKIDDPDINVSTKWIPVKKEKPKEDGRHLICVSGARWNDPFKGGRVFVADYFYNDWIYKGWEYRSVIAWQPLPEPYDESEG